MWVFRVKICYEIVVFIIFSSFLFSIYYGNRAADLFHAIKHRDEKDYTFIPLRNRLPILVFTKEFNDFLLKGNKEEISKVMRHVFRYFISLAVMIVLILLVVLSKYLYNLSF
jgi:hypothetical protein